jgi:hypothetical protein
VLRRPPFPPQLPPRLPPCQPGLPPCQPGLPPRRPGLPPRRPGLWPCPPGSAQHRPGFARQRPEFRHHRPGFPQRPLRAPRHPPGIPPGRPGFPQRPLRAPRHPPGIPPGRPGLPRRRPGLPAQGTGRRRTRPSGGAAAGGWGRRPRLRRPSLPAGGRWSRRRLAVGAPVPVAQRPGRGWPRLDRGRQPAAAGRTGGCELAPPPGAARPPSLLPVVQRARWRAGLPRRGLVQAGLRRGVRRQCPQGPGRPPPERRQARSRPRPLCALRSAAGATAGPAPARVPPRWQRPLAPTPRAAPRGGRPRWEHAEVPPPSGALRGRFPRVGDPWPARRRRVVPCRREASRPCGAPTGAPVLAALPRSRLHRAPPAPRPGLPRALRRVGQVGRVGRVGRRPVRVPRAPVRPAMLPGPASRGAPWLPASPGELPAVGPRKASAGPRVVLRSSPEVRARPCFPLPAPGGPWTSCGPALPVPALRVRPPPVRALRRIREPRLRASPGLRPAPPGKPRRAGPPARASPEVSARPRWRRARSGTAARRLRPGERKPQAAGSLSCSGSPAAMAGASAVPPPARRRRRLPDSCRAPGLLRECYR